MARGDILQDGRRTVRERPAVFCADAFLFHPLDQADVLRGFLSLLRVAHKLQNGLCVLDGVADRRVKRLLLLRGARGGEVRKVRRVSPEVVRRVDEHVTVLCGGAELGNIPRLRAHNTSSWEFLRQLFEWVCFFPSKAPYKVRLPA